MKNQPTLVLNRVLRVLQPLVRLLIQNGVTYPVLAAALKRLFLDAARAELARQGMSQSDSAASLLSGVHRRDVRTLTEAAKEAADQAANDAANDATSDAASQQGAAQKSTRLAAPAPPGPLGLAAQVVARWMHATPWQDAQGMPAVLPRSAKAPSAASFDALVASVSSDVRPRAVLDELLRLGVVQEDAQGIHLEGSGFAPRQGFEEMSWLFAANLADHAAAASANLIGEGNFLEQAVFVDHISADSAARLQKVSVQAWQRAFNSVMAEAQSRYDNDTTLPAAEQKHRARFGVYFYSEPED
jgi:hypothetical protein